VVLAESGRLVNALSEDARRDAVRHAGEDLAEAEDRLRALRQDLRAFRAAHRIVDPQADMAGRMGLLGALEADLAEALVERDMVATYAEAGDHRIEKADTRIAAVRARIEAERTALGIGTDGAAMTDVVGRYEEILTDIEFARAAYTQALANLSAARAEARRQARYLAAHIRPTLATTAEYPRRLMIWALLTALLALGWAAAAVVAYNLRDAR
jgi:capsular polysaccharide transport system permease protein